MSDLSPGTKALLQAARGDGPSAAARAKIWTGVSGGATAAGAGAAGAAAAGKAAAAGSAKLLALGALLGSTATVGIAAMALRLGSPSLVPEPTVIVAEHRAEEIAPASRGSAQGAGATPSSEALEGSGRASRAGAGLAGSSATPTRGHGRSGPGKPGRKSDDDDALTREAAILAQARGALMRGQPETALAAIRAARSLPVRALEPETMALEARALRAEGHFDEADAVEARLRAKYPENGLAR